MGKVYNNFPVFENDEVKVNSLVKNVSLRTQGYILKDSVYVVRRDRKMIPVNQNNKIPRGYIVGRITALKPKKISEIHARQDTEEKIENLGMTDTVKMKIETSDPLQIKNKPYQVSLN